MTSSWKEELETLVRNQMRYAWADLETGQSYDPNPEPFLEALGYILEFVTIERKKAYFEGYREGGKVSDELVSEMVEYVKNLPITIQDPKRNDHLAERAWNKRESE